MLEVRADRPAPVDLDVAWAAIAVAPIERAGHRATHRFLEALHQIVDHLLHHGFRGVAGAGGDGAGELQQGADEVHVRFDGLQQFGFEQQLPQTELLDRVPLHHLHDRRGEVLADVAEPPVQLG